MASFADDAGREHELAFVELSEGLQVLATLYAVLHGATDPGRVFCFDEPENFVGLTEIQPWLQDLNDALGEQEGQAFVVSHHPEVIDYLAAESAFRFERPGGGPARCKEVTFDRSKGLKASELIALGG